MVDAKQLVVSEVSQMLTLPTDSFSFDTNLYQLGLHSLLILRLSERFSAQCGIYIGYLPLASHPTLNEWIAFVDNAWRSSLITAHQPQSFPIPGCNHKE
ncbi:acyl carrier protein [Vibrio sp. V27_P1S3P104]|uniref:acyl carrier protein n=1 Tax=Vibrio TaxID=662 RepID=UPI000C169C55|nr:MULTISPECIES: acyl carrier protein [Vibrio]NAW68694.1 acyl carrier protein [Vibrio sp. V28_P6S34P95]NAX04400.1 acyl carrier protein [Vibrio sp. V30_P3S12P165]NAX33117.1 acyl carrier protein [Vibrio sp. V29_P1S30P107]NAX36915.1 acyl carrier protein [Vibrio sp. V27_P1S3P104]NAX40977.1 acyl carrier protein [Vibrio sp. V26_P1S5P106]